MSYIDPRSKLLRHLDTLAALQAGQVPPPVNIEIDLSNRCSLGCEWCHFAYTHTRGPLAGKQGKPAQTTPGGDLMDYELALQIVAQLEAYGVRSITWTGGGEPTLHPSFDNVIAFTAERKIGQGLYTNGGHIWPERAAILKKAMTWIYVSLDAADAESYKQHKGVDRFERVLQSVRHLVKASGGATIGLGFLLTCDNWTQFWRMAELGRGLGVDYVQFRPTVLPGEDTFWLGECIDSLKYARGEPMVEIDIDRFEAYQFWKGHGYPVCYWSAMQTVITPNGKVWTCVNKREHAGAEIGDLSAEAFADIWGRRKIAAVDSDCRVMCRGHVPNLALNEIMADQPHGSFI